MDLGRFILVFLRFLSFGYGGWSYSNFLASTVKVLLGARSIQDFTPGHCGMDPLPAIRSQYGQLLKSSVRCGEPSFGEPQDQIPLAAFSTGWCIALVGLKWDHASPWCIQGNPLSIDVCIYIYTYTREIYTYTHTYTFICIHVRVYMCMYIFMHMCIYIYMYMYMYIYMYI